MGEGGWDGGWVCEREGGREGGMGGRGRGENDSRKSWKKGAETSQCTKLYSTWYQLLYSRPHNLQEFWNELLDISHVVSLADLHASGIL